MFKKMVRKEKTPAVASAPATADPTNPALLNAAQQAHFRAAQAMYLQQQRQVYLAAFGDQAALQGAGGGNGAGGGLEYGQKIFVYGGGTGAKIWGTGLERQS